MKLLVFLSTLVPGLLARRLTLVAENLALRQQVAILLRSHPRPRIRWRDLGAAVALVRRLAFLVGHCQTRDGAALASPRVSMALVARVRPRQAG